MQTILGAGGTIGTELARILPEHAERVRLVSRRPERVIASNELHAADLLDRDQVIKALEDTDIAYLVAGLPYRTKVWRQQWPILMKNTIAACKSNGCRLVFFDNVYMYDREHLPWMTEQTAIRPTSNKGQVRAEVLQQLMRAVEDEEIEALVARSADFYGPGRQQNSVLTQTVFERLNAGKPAQWLMSPDHKHSFTYTPDAARATAMLGNAEDTWGDVWHLPTASQPLTGREWIEAIARALGTPPRMRVFGRLALGLAGILAPQLREVSEMAYQFDRDYVFSSEKFCRHFNYEPVNYHDGIRAIVDADYR